MLTLAIDTAANFCSACLWDEASDRVLAAEERDIGRGHAEQLMDVIAAVIGKAGRDYADLSRIAVAIGPGGEARPLGSASLADYAYVAYGMAEYARLSGDPTDRTFVAALLTTEKVVALLAPRLLASEPSLRALRSGRGLYCARIRPALMTGLSQFTRRIE